MDTPPHMLFVSHGSPMLMLEDSPARRFLVELGQSLPRPRAIVTISAHWENVGGMAVGTAPHFGTLHDFFGFPRALYGVRYPAPGAPGLAQRCEAWLAGVGVPVRVDAERPLDHGVWVPLSLMFGAADIPLCPLSLVRGADIATHYRIGQALQRLGEEEGVLIIASGSMTHNLSEAIEYESEAREEGWAREFADWMASALQQGRIADLLAWRQNAPWARRNHPSEEHLAPLFMLLGMAGESWRAQRLFSGSVHGVIAMDCFRVDPAGAVL